MTIHATHPFADPPGSRDAARRLRGHLPAPVTLWGAGVGAGRAGLTVSSLMVALGEPAHVLGLLDPDADLTVALQREGCFALSLLDASQRRLVDVFAGLAPSPGGPFAAASFTHTPWGPRPDASDTWAGARVVGVREVGWSLEVTAVLEHVVVGGAEGLVHLRGRLLAP